jgi:hypothetical protein
LKLVAATCAINFESWIGDIGRMLIFLILDGRVGEKKGKNTYISVREKYQRVFWMRGGDKQDTHFMIFYMMDQLGLLHIPRR